MTIIQAVTVPAGEGLVDLLVEEPGWTEALPDLSALAGDVAARGLTLAGVKPGSVHFCLMATNDEVIRNLNRDHRGNPVATNVLSWPALELAPQEDGAAPASPPQPDPAGGRVFIGDVALALQTVAAEAQAAKRDLKDHAIHLILHGVLHLLGHDHLRPGDAARMEEIERQVLKSVGIADPYLEAEPD